VVYFDSNKPSFTLLHNFFKELDHAKESVENFFKELLIVSNFDVVTHPDDLKQSELEGLYVTVKKAPGNKCPRCWKWNVTAHPDMLCKRCQKVLEEVI